MRFSDVNKIWRGAFFALAFGLASTRVLASPADPAEGRRHFQSGLELSNMQSFEEALTEFQRAYQLDRRPSALRNVAFCLKELHRYAEARAALERLLAAHAAELTPTVRDEVTEELRAMPSEPATPAPTLTPSPTAPPALLVPAPNSTAPLSSFDITVLPDGATIAIDGQSVGVGHARGVVAVGRHTLEVSATGYGTIRKEIDIVEGRTLAQDVVLTSLTPMLSTPRPAEDAPKTPANDYAGFYANLDLLAAFKVGGIAPLDCPTTATCSNPTKAVGGGLGLRVGYSFGFIGVEVAAAFNVDYRAATHNFPGTPNPTTTVVDDTVERDERYTTVSINGFIGAGPRVTSPGQSVRATFGITPGLALGEYALNRTTSGSVISTITSSAHYKGFGLLMDGGVLIGSTPGLKLYLGAFAWLAFPGTIATPASAPSTVDIVAVPPIQATYDNPSYTLGSGTQVTVGPIIGLQFGH